MSLRSKAILARARRLNQEIGPRLITWENNPEVRRLQHLGLLRPLSMASAREALIGRDHHVALDETTEMFHDRLRALAKERGALMVILGHESNAVPPREAPPYPVAAPAVFTPSPLGGRFEGGRG
jgi:hypothetical protein